MSTDRDAQIMPLYHEKAIRQTPEGFWALYRKRGGYLEPVGIRETKAEAEGWLGYPLPEG